MVKYSTETQRAMMVGAFRAGATLTRAGKIGGGFSRVTAWRATKRMISRGNVRRKKGSGRPTKLTNRVGRTIASAIKLNRYITAEQLAEELKKRLGLQAHATSVRKWRKQMGYTKRLPVVRPVLNKMQMKARNVEATKLLRRALPRSSVYADEAASVVLESPRPGWYLPGEHDYQSVPERSPSVHFLVAGSLKGKISLSFIDSPNNSQNYCKAVSQGPLNQLQQTNVLYRTDNARTHTSKYTQQWLKKKGVKTSQQPPQSPDFMPMENVIHLIKLRLRKQQCRTVNSKKRAIRKAWNDVSDRQVIACIQHLPTVYRKVKELRGGNYYPTRWLIE